MAIVNFAIPKTLDRRIKEVIKEKGFASKAELFRLAVIHYLEGLDKPWYNEEEKFDYLTRALSQETVKAHKGKKISSVREQLVDLYIYVSGHNFVIL